MPESTHMVMWIMSDRAIAPSYRMMEGFGVHSFRLANAQRARRQPLRQASLEVACRVHGLAWDEAQKLAGKNPDFHRCDLPDAIDTSTSPSGSSARR